MKRSVLKAAFIVILVVLGSVNCFAEPKCESVTFDPEQPVTGDTLKLRIKLGEDAVRAEVNWKLNDDEVTRTDFDGFSPHITFPKKIFRSDKIVAEITPFSSTGVSGKTETKTVTVENAGPTLKLTDQRVSSSMYTAKVHAADPEGSTVTLTLEKGPEGMTVDPQGNIQWKISESVSGSFPVSISAKDDKGSETQIQFNVGLKWQGGGKK